MSVQQHEKAEVYLRKAMAHRPTLEAQVAAAGNVEGMKPPLEFLFALALARLSTAWALKATVSSRQSPCASVVWPVHTAARTLLCRCTFEQSARVQDLADEQVGYLGSLLDKSVPVRLRTALSGQLTDALIKCASTAVHTCCSLPLASTLTVLCLQAR